MTFLSFEMCPKIFSGDGCIRESLIINIKRMRHCMHKIFFQFMMNDDQDLDGECFDENIMKRSLFFSQDVFQSQYLLITHIQILRDVNDTLDDKCFVGKEE